MSANAAASLPARGPLWLLGAGLLLALFAAPGPHPWDAGELVAAALRLGGSHPPGQPLHALLAHPLSWLPIGPLPYRIALGSALFATIAAWLVYRIAAELLEWFLPDRDRGGAARRLAPHAAALATLLSGPVLRQALRVEVYGLALALALGAALALLRWARGDRAALRWAALLAGLCAAAHPPLALASIALGALWWRPGPLRRRLGEVALAAPFFLLGLGVYALLPLRALAGAPMWGDPTRLDGFWRYVSGAAYHQNLGAGDRAWLTQIVEGISFVGLASGLIPLLGVGMLLLCRDRACQVPGARVRLALTPFVAGIPVMMQPLRSENPDAVAYAGLGVALLLAFGAAGLASLAARRPALGLTLLGLLGLHPLGASAAWELGQADPASLETLAANLTQTPPPRALVVARTDFVAASWMMAREVDGARPDVAVFVPGLGTSSWHWRSLREHPLYDGRPLRGPGEDASRAYLRGALTRAGGQVGIAAEDDASVGGRGQLAGPYLLLPAPRPDPPTPWLRDSMAERLVPELQRGLRAAQPRGGGEHPDVDTIAAIVRRSELDRARRLLRRGALEPSRRAYQGAASFLPEAERELLLALRALPPGPLPRAIRDAASMLVSREDAVREIAVALWAGGAQEAAASLLSAQLERGDPRALLQLAWLQEASGARALASASLEAFEREAPSLAPVEARALARRLREGGP